LVGCILDQTNGFLGPGQVAALDLTFHNGALGGTLSVLALDQVGGAEGPGKTAALGLNFSDAIQRDPLYIVVFVLDQVGGFERAPHVAPFGLGYGDIALGLS
jgi:hypothetical protein